MRLWGMLSKKVQEEVTMVIPWKKKSANGEIIGWKPDIEKQNLKKGSIKSIFPKVKFTAI